MAGMPLKQMIMEKDEQNIGQAAAHLKAVLEKPEMTNALDIGFLFVHMDLFAFRDALKAIAKAYEQKTGNLFQTELIVNADDADFAKDDTARKSRLRQMKALREDSRVNKIITRFVAKGKPGLVDLEPNVFASDVRFEPI